MVNIYEENINSVCEEALPEPLAAYRAKLCGGLLITGIIAIIAVLLLRQIEAVFFLLLPAYIAFKVCSVRRDWNAGFIKEAIVQCRYIRTKPVSGKTLAGFCEYGEEGQPDIYYLFAIRNRETAEDFIPEAMYRIYFRDSDPHNLLAYIQL